MQNPWRGVWFSLMVGSIHIHKLNLVNDLGIFTTANRFLSRQIHNRGARGVNTSTHNFFSFFDSINLKLSCSHSLYLFLGGCRSKIPGMSYFLSALYCEMKPTGFTFLIFCFLHKSTLNLV